MSGYQLGLTLVLLGLAAAVGFTLIGFAPNPATCIQAARDGWPTYYDLHSGAIYVFGIATLALAFAAGRASAYGESS